MPAPRWLARINKHLTNRILGLLVGRVPPFAALTHVGRRSGRRYETVVWAFRVPGGWAVALTYGSDSDWVRNVLASGHARLRHTGGSEDLVNPQLVEGTGLLQGPLHLPLRLLRVDRVLRLETGSRRSPSS